MSKGRLLDGVSPIEEISPTDSLDTLFLKSGSSTAHSPQSLRAKPWPARPQQLCKGIRGWRWWDSALDVVVVMLPMPFFVLAAAVIFVNGKIVDQEQFTILDHSIKGVSKTSRLSKADPN